MSVRRREGVEANAEEPGSLTLRDIAKAYFKSNPGAIDMKAFVEHAKKLGVQRLTGIDKVHRGRTTAEWAADMTAAWPHIDRCSIAATLPRRSARRCNSASRLRRTATSSTFTITPSKNASTCGRSRARRPSTET